jgi:hypothetical protein
MALLAAGSLTNVYASLDLYLQSQLVTTAGLTVRLHGVRRFVPPIDTPWVEAHYDFLGLQQVFQRHAGAGQFATDRQGYLQLNIFQRMLVFPQRYTTAAARDLVIAAFPEGGLLPIYDVAGAAPNSDPVQVGDMIIDGTKEHVIDTGIRGPVTQHVVQVDTRYLEFFTRA